MQTRTGGRTTVKSMTKKHGTYKAYCAWMRSLGRKGGKATGVKGFAIMPKKKRIEYGRLGGQRSRRGPKVVK